MSAICSILRAFPHALLTCNLRVQICVNNRHNNMAEGEVRLRTSDDSYGISRYFAGLPSSQATISKSIGACTTDISCRDFNNWEKRKVQMQSADNKC